MSSTISHSQARLRPWTPAAWIAIFIIPLGVLLGLAACSRTGTILITLAVVALICAVGVRHQWGTAICIAPVFLFPVTDITSLSNVGSIHWRLILAIVSAVLATSYWRQGAGRPNLNAWSFAAVGFLSIALLVLGARTQASIQNALSLALFAYSGLIVGQCLRHPATIRAIAILTVPLAALAILEALGLENLWGTLLHANAYIGPAIAHNAHRSDASFGHPLIAGACLMATGLLLLSARERLMTVSGIICMFAAVTTVSRSALLGGALGITLFALQARGRRMRIVAVVTVLVLSMIVVVNSVPALQRSVEKRITGLSQGELSKQETVRTNSLAIFGNEINVDPDRLLIGGGVEYSVAVLTARGGNAEGYNIFDNEYITMMYDGGLLVVLVVFFLLIIAAATSSPVARRNALPALAALVVVMYFVDGMESPSLSFMTWMVIGFFTIQLPSTTARFRVQKHSMVATT
jgi:hypothetical protein